MDNKRKEISGNQPMTEVLTTLAEGNVGALTVLMRLIRENQMSGFLAVLNLDDMNIRGEQVWVGYKDFCKEDLGLFRSVVQKRDPEMVKFLNTTDRCSGPWLAVTGGGSYGQRPRKPGR